MDSSDARGLIDAAGLDALAYFASKTAIDRAIRSLERCEFRAWKPEISKQAARELKALAECYGKGHGAPAGA